MIKFGDIVKVAIEDRYEEDINKIVKNTENTWQSERSEYEKKKDSILGKQAESVFQMFVNIDNNEFEYISYDSFRGDDFKNHAPFDGLYVSKNTEKSVVNEYMKKIVELMNGERYGKLSKISKLRDEMRRNNIFIVEVKSTRLTDINISNGVINYDRIRFHDFLSYPRFLRKTSENNFYNEDYYSYVEKKYGIGKEKINNFEEESVADILVRIYIDQKNNLAYLMGYMTKNTFSKNRKIKKMIKKDKSESALYWAAPLYLGSPIKNLIKNVKPENNPKVKKIKFRQ